MHSQHQKSTLQLEKGKRGWKLILISYEGVPSRQFLQTFLSRLRATGSGRAFIWSFCLFVFATERAPLHGVELIVFSVRGLLWEGFLLFLTEFAFYDTTVRYLPEMEGWRVFATRTEMSEGEKGGGCSSRGKEEDSKHSEGAGKSI